MAEDQLSDIRQGDWNDKEYQVNKARWQSDDKVQVCVMLLHCYHQHRVEVVNI